MSSVPTVALVPGHHYGYGELYRTGMNGAASQIGLAIGEAIEQSVNPQNAGQTDQMGKCNVVVDG